MIPKRILLTGSSGQLGSELGQQLCINNPVLGVDSKAGMHRNHAYPSVVTDLTEEKQVSTLMEDFQPEVIVNCAAFTNVDACEIDSEKAMRVNGWSVKLLCDLAARDTKFLQISTDYVFDGTDGPYSEDEAKNPLSVYGASKLMAETLLAESDLSHIIIRPIVLYSGRTEDSASFFAWVYNSLLSGKTIHVVTDQFANATWTTGLVDAITLAFRKDAEGIFHFGASDILSRYEFAKLLARTFGFNEELVQATDSSQFKQRAARPKNSSLNCEKIQNELNAKLFSTEEAFHIIKSRMEKI